MSYINEINGFHKWVQTHPELPTSARILWFTLMHYNNSCGWKRVFNVPISLLMGDSGLSRSSIVRARKLLQESGRIRYTTRSDMKATEYELLPMSDEPGIATGYDTCNTRRDTEHDTGYDKGYATERDTLHDTVYDTWHDTKDDTVYDTPHDIVYDNTCDIAHDTQDGHIPRLDQTNTIQDNQTRPDSLSEFSFSGGEKKEKEKKENAYRSDNADMHGNIMYDDEMHDGTMYDDTMYDDNMRNNKVYDDNMHNDNMREEKIKEEEFIPPTVEMVEAYCKERGNVIDPEMFVAYYDSIGWVRGKYPMKDWKAAVRSWEKYDAEYRENGYY